MTASEADDPRVAPDVVVNAEPFPDAPVPLVERAVRLTLADAGVRRGELSVTLLDDATIAALNRDYLDRDRVTDVIAFSLGEPDGDLLGDVYIGYPQARRQASEHGVHAEEEVVRLTVHGTLHVLGHHHPDGHARFDSPMFVLQERLVREVLARDE